MDKNIKKKWVKALRSGKYKQTTTDLCDITSNTHCCLGVLCEVLIKDGHNIRKTTDGCFSFNKKRKMGGQLSTPLLNHVGLTAEQQTYLIHLNDEKEWSFKHIADAIAKDELDETDI